MGQFENENKMKMENENVKMGTGHNKSLNISYLICLNGVNMSLEALFWGQNHHFNN